MNVRLIWVSSLAFRKYFFLRRMATATYLLIVLMRAAYLDLVTGKLLLFNGMLEAPLIIATTDLLAMITGINSCMRICRV